MDYTASPSSSRFTVTGPVLAGVACVSAALLMTELALTRIFSVTMYYHFAFLAISIALFGLSRQRRLRLPGPAAARPTRRGATARLARPGVRAGDDGVAGPARPPARRAELLAREPLADARHLRACGSAVLRRRRGDHARRLAAVGANQPGLRLGPAWRLRRLPAAAAAARPRRRAGRGPRHGVARRRRGGPLRRPPLADASPASRCC